MSIRPAIHRPAYTVAAAIATTFVMGSIHAFSVIGLALEVTLGAPRDQISSIYAVALLSLTLAVLVSPLLYRRCHPLALLAAAFALSAAALAMCLHARSVWLLLFSYGIGFGAANGIAYALALALGAAAIPRRKGLVMSVVTASYAIGAAVAAELLGMVITRGTPVDGFRLLLLCVLGAGAIACVLAYAGGSGLASGVGPRGAAGAWRQLTVLLWLGYGSAVFAGLMSIGHAAGIAAAQGASPRQLAHATMLIALGNALGGFASATVADRWSVRRLLASLPLFCLLGIALLRLAPGLGNAMLGLALVGFGYGALIAAYPPCIARTVGLSAYPTVYGRVFTAWGIAALTAPWLAGWLFARQGVYASALELAALMALLSMAVILAGAGRLRLDTV